MKCSNCQTTRELPPSKAKLKQQEIAAELQAQSFYTGRPGQDLPEKVTRKAADNYKTILEEIKYSDKVCGA